VQLTTGIPGITSSTTHSPKSSARRCAHEGQRQLVLQENARTRELPQDLHRILPGQTSPPGAGNRLGPIIAIAEAILVILAISE